MRIEDISNALGLTLDKEEAGLYKTTDTTRSDALTLFGFMFDYTYKSEEYAPENYLKEKYGEKYSSLTNKKIGDLVDVFSYMYFSNDTDIVDQDSKLYEILFKGTTEEDYAKSYWLASSGASANDFDYNDYLFFRAWLCYAKYCSFRRNFFVLF
jgi:hypothetical protein